MTQQNIDSKKQNLFVYGCSFSDRYGSVIDSYGDIISKKLNLNYFHNARICGSNFAISRSLNNHIMNRQISNNDIVVIQYTEVTRREFITEANVKVPNEVYEKFNDSGLLLRFKLGAHEWHKHESISTFFQIYEKYLINDDYDNELFIQTNYSNQCVLFANNIKNVIIMRLSYYGLPTFKWVNLNELNPYILEDDQTYRNLPYAYSDDDRFHLSSEGHNHLANRIIDIIKSNRMLLNVDV